MAAAASGEVDWLGLSEASSYLGVSPATLRRWSDAGRLRVFTTPGGHRRFSRAALDRLLPVDRARRPPIAGTTMAPSRIARTYRRATRHVRPTLGWVLALSEEQRELFRERGQLLAASLIQHLDATRPENAEHHLRTAAVSAGEYGKLAAGLGLSLSQTVEGFLRFRAPFHQQLVLAAQRRGFDTGETTDLLLTAERAVDQLLMATMTGHSVASVRPRGTARAAQEANR